MTSLRNFKSSFHLQALQFISCFDLSLFFLFFSFEIVKLNGEFSLNIKTKLLLRSSSSASSSTPPKDLGTVCQNVWNAAAGNNLRVTSELFVDLAGKNPLFTVNGAGVDKINTLEFIRFRGNSFLLK